MIANCYQLLHIDEHGQPVHETTPLRGRSFMTSATLGGGGGQPNSDIC